MSDYTICAGQNGFKLMPRVILICSCIKKKNVFYETNYSIEQPRPKVVKSSLGKKINLLSTIYNPKVHQIQLIKPTAISNYTNYWSIFPKDQPSKQMVR